MSQLTETEIQGARDWASGVSGCTCHKDYNGSNYVVLKHACAYCVAWDKKLRDAGLGNGPKPTESGKGKRKYRRAA
jgi:hypothetical protein